MKHYIEFYYNNKPYKIDFSTNSKYRPSDSLLYFIKKELNIKASREGCGIGDCGACTVVLASPKDNGFLYYAVNSCIMMLASIDGKWLITADLLRNNDNLHPIQKTILEHYGTQCGYCTAGMLMSMFAMYKNFTHPTRLEIDEHMAGNLCRCTGYKPIIDAIYSACTGEKDYFTLLEPKVSLWYNKLEHTGFEADNYFRPKTLETALKEYKDECVAMCGSSELMIKIKKTHKLPNKILDLSNIDELKGIKTLKDSTLVIGATANIEMLRNIVKESHKTLYTILGRFASHQIRNVASLAANISSASPIGDSIPILNAYMATINTAYLDENGQTKFRNIAIKDFIVGYRTNILFKNEIITSISIPPSKSNLIIKAYKISNRHSVDISTLNLAARIELDSNKAYIKHIKLFYGGMAALVKDATNTESFIIGKNIQDLSLIKISDFKALIEKDFSPLNDVRATKEERIELASNLVKLLILELIEDGKCRK